MILKGKPPRQARSRQTVEYILEATTQVLDRSEKDQLTTNHIAKRAGFSIGTLYQYFTNKNTLFRSVAMRELAKVESEAVKVLLDAREVSTELMIRGVVRAAISPFDFRLNTRRRLIFLLFNDDALRNESYALFCRLLDRLETELLSADPARYRVLSSAERAVLRGAFIGSLRVTLVQEPETLKTAEFEDALVDLLASRLSSSSQ